MSGRYQEVVGRIQEAYDTKDLDTREISSFRDIPFYKSPDWDSEKPTHCMQAVAKMVLEYFNPGREYSWDELTELSCKRPGKYTTTTGIILSFNEIGLDAFQITDFDYRRFAGEGMGYIRERYVHNPDEVESWPRTLNVKYEQSLAARAIQINPGAFENKAPTINDLRKFSQEPNTLVTCQVNARRLKNQEGNVGHFLLLTGLSKSEVFFHDPGGSTHPPGKNRRVNISVFLGAWAGEEGKDGTVIVIRRKS